MQDRDVRFRLAIPIDDAFAFAMGEFNLGYADASDAMRQLVGALVIDSLEYTEHWRIATEARTLLASRWPGCPSFGAGPDPE